MNEDSFGRLVSYPPSRLTTGSRSIAREEPGLTVVGVACETKGLIALLRTFMHYLSLGLKYRES